MTVALLIYFSYINHCTVKGSWCILKASRPAEPACWGCWLTGVSLLACRAQLLHSAVPPDPATQHIFGATEKSTELINRFRGLLQTKLLVDDQYYWKSKGLSISVVLWQKRLFVSDRYAKPLLIILYVRFDTNCNNIFGRNYKKHIMHDKKQLIFLVM